MGLCKRLSSQKELNTKLDKENMGESINVYSIKNT